MIHLHDVLSRRTMREMKFSKMVDPESEYLNIIILTEASFTSIPGTDTKRS